MIAAFKNGFTAEFSTDLSWPVAAVIVSWSPDVPTPEQRAEIQADYLRALGDFMLAMGRAKGGDA